VPSRLDIRKGPEDWVQKQCFAQLNVAILTVRGHLFFVVIDKGVLARTPMFCNIDKYLTEKLEHVYYLGGRLICIAHLRQSLCQPVIPSGNDCKKQRASEPLLVS